jgi:sialic acid synthase SpsE
LVGSDRRVLVVAEAGINHNGELDRALEMIRVAGECGADAIKFQTFRAETFISDAESIFVYQTARGTVQEKSLEMFRRVELEYAWHERLFAAARQAGLLIFSTPCDAEAVELLDALDVPMFKISSDYLTHHDFLRLVARKGRPLIVSTGMATLGDIEEALEAIYSTGNRQVILLHCVSAYPTPLEQINLRAMETLRRAFGCPVGFSDHTQGVTVPVAAAALGAVLIEKHFTLDKGDGAGPDHWFSVDPEELRGLVQAVRTVEQALGQPGKVVVPAEAESRVHARMSVVAAVDIPAGTTLTEAMLAVKRPGTGIPPKELRNLVGQVALQDLARDQVLKWEHLGQPGRRD